MDALFQQQPASWSFDVDLDDFKDTSLPPVPASRLRDDKHVRRRSSKACDQCRKSKCKCERPDPHDDACRNCVLLGTPCTFLGPSRKRGPPKGYIDAIESRLHQLEAILGTLLTSDDPRARSLLDDLSADPLAREILDRVDSSPFGSRPTPRPTDALEDRASRLIRASPPTHPFPFPSPTTEWQEHLRDRLRASAHRDDHTAASAGPESPRQRRRLDSSSSPQFRLTSLPTSSSPPHSPSHSHSSPSSEDDDEISSAIGQLSLNEDSQVRYHGKASGLHILGKSDRLDKRNEGGIWRFPKAGVWPRAPDATDRARADLLSAERHARSRFPPPAVQQHLLELYFVYVHPVLPLMHEAKFWRDFRGQPADTPYAPRVPTLLLLAMFSIAARYRFAPDAPLPQSAGDMWSAGDEFLEHAKRILNQTYASSRPSTCQALLLMSYREIGIGGMAQAWLYVGMAVRMAQDLGMHRSAEKWLRTGAELFTEPQRQLRKRIWYACVIMDKYVSTYIGRPLSIFERDFDTPYPAEDPAEENMLWARHPSASPGADATAVPDPAPVPTHLISCFTASARLASILGHIVTTIYAVHGRLADAAALEARLDRWYLELPPHLQLPPAVASPGAGGAGSGGAGGVPPPHVYTLHMQYWCAVLLLHRPFMRRRAHSVPEAEAETARKAFDLCAMAASKISNTVSQYGAAFCLQRCPAFLTYYVFSASITHMTTLSVRPMDVQAGMGLQRCMHALQMMQVVWPSAARAWDLMHGAKIDLHGVASQTQQLSQQQSQQQRPQLQQQRQQQQQQQRQQQPQPPQQQQLLLLPHEKRKREPEPAQYIPTQYAAPSTRWAPEQTTAVFPYNADPLKPVTLDLWKGFPEGFGGATGAGPGAGGDVLPASLYGMPVLSGEASVPPQFVPLGGAFPLYSNVPPTVGDVQDPAVF